MTGGFTSIPNVLMPHLLKLPPIPFKVYVYLRSKRNRGTGQLNPSVDTIAAVAELERKTVYGALAVLENAKLIARKRTNRSNAYVLIDAAADVPPDGTAEARADVPSNGISKLSDVPPDGTPGCPVGRDTNQKKEPDKAHAAHACAAPVLTFAVKGGTWSLPKAKLDEYRQTFPTLDVLGEFRKARQWCADNPNRRKSSRGMPRFLFNWLSNAKPNDGDICPLDAEPVVPTDAEFVEIMRDEE